MNDLKIQLFADGANRDQILKHYKSGIVKGFTTNPSLMAKAGIKDYEAFARSILSEITNYSISFEVFADEFPEMERQAMKIGDWAKNIHVKIPITNTKRESSLPLIRKLLNAGLKLNVTAIFTQDQLDDLRQILMPKDDVIVSIFAGRIADAGVDPMPLMAKAVRDYQSLAGSKILWASSREAWNVYQADQVGCHIITCTDDILSKMSLWGKSMSDFSLDTVKAFYKDATSAGFRL